MFAQAAKKILRGSLRPLLGKSLYERLRRQYSQLLRPFARANHRYKWVKKHGLRYYRVYGYRYVQTGMAEDHVLALFDTAYSLADGDPVVVEIGSWLGRSAVALSLGIKRKKGAVLYCIDPFNADSDPVSAKNLGGIAQELGVPLLELFTRNVKRYGSYKHVRPLQGYSTDFSKDWNKPIDMLFIDGNHSYEGAKRDFLEWSPFVKPGGYLAMHDVSNDPNFKHPDPIKVAREFIFDNDEWCDIKMVRHLLIVRKALSRSKP